RAGPGGHAGRARPPRPLGRPRVLLSDRPQGGGAAGPRRRDRAPRPPGGEPHLVASGGVLLLSGGGAAAADRARPGGHHPRGGAVPGLVPRSGRPPQSAARPRAVRQRPPPCRLDPARLRHGRAGGGAGGAPPAPRSRRRRHPPPPRRLGGPRPAGEAGGPRRPAAPPGDGRGARAPPGAPSMKLQKKLREILYRLRTEGGSPGKVAAAVGLGVFIGCSPFWGFHIVLCLLLARLLGLNRVLTALASHISFPGFSLLVIWAEVEIGRWLRRAPLLSAHSFKADDLWHLAWWKQCGFDVVVGSFILGPVLALLLAVPTYWIALRRSREPERTALIEEAAYCYLGTGMFNWEFVRGKLRHD